MLLIRKWSDETHDYVTAVGEDGKTHEFRRETGSAIWMKRRGPYARDPHGWKPASRFWREMAQRLWNKRSEI